MTAIYIRKNGVNSTVYVDRANNVYPRIRQLERYGAMITSVRPLKRQRIEPKRFAVKEYRADVWADNMTKPQAQRELDRLRKKFPDKKFIMLDIRHVEQQKEWQFKNRETVGKKLPTILTLNGVRLHERQVRALRSFCTGIDTHKIHKKTLDYLALHGLSVYSDKKWKPTKAGREWIRRANQREFGALLN